MANPAGESKDAALKLDFDRRVMLQFRGSAARRRIWAEHDGGRDPTMRAPARTNAMHWSVCCGNRCLVVSLDMRT
jgi:hypothetical protein